MITLTLKNGKTVTAKGSLIMGYGQVLGKTFISYKGHNVPVEQSVEQIKSAIERSLLSK